MEEAASSCAIDALTIFCKRFPAETSAYEGVDADEAQALFQSISEGEASRSELEGASTMSTLWTCLIKVAQSIKLAEICDLENFEFSNLSEEVTRFLGAFLASAEVILDAAPSNVDEIARTLESLFVPASKAAHKADHVLELVRSYKDWFNYCYMFNRRAGKNPKSCFDRLSRHYQAQSSASANSSGSPLSLSRSMDSVDEDDDTINDSFGHDQFLSIPTPQIAPLDPFAAQGLTGNRDLSAAPRRDIDSPDHLTERSILDSYLNGWGPTVEEDEDSDVDSSYFLMQKKNRRMTRMKSAGADKGRKTKKLTRRRTEDGGLESPTSVLKTSFKNSVARVNKSVTFADELHQASPSDTSEDWGRRSSPLRDSVEAELKELHDTKQDKAKRIIFSSLEVSSSADVVQGFESSDDLRPPPAKDFPRQLSRPSSESSLDLSDKEKSRSSFVKYRPTQRADDSWASSLGPRKEKEREKVDSGERAMRLELDNDEESGEDFRIPLTNHKDSSSSTIPWASSSAPAPRKNPLDASLEEEEFRTKAEMSRSTVAASDPDYAPRNDVSPPRKSPMNNSDFRSSEERPRILSPPAKLSVAKASPHRYASYEPPSDTEGDGSLLRGAPSHSTSSSLVCPTADKSSLSRPRQEAINRLMQNVAKHKQMKKSPNKAISLRMSSSSWSSEHGGRSIFGGQSEIVIAPSLSPSKKHLSSSSSHKSLLVPSVSSPILRKERIVHEERDHTRGPSKKYEPAAKLMPSRLVLDKKPSPTIRSEVFELMQGRRRTRPPALTVPNETTKLLKPTPVGVSTSPVMKNATRPVAPDVPFLPAKLSTEVVIPREKDRTIRSSQVIQSMAFSAQGVFDKPFQDLPANADIPELSELALSTGVIMEGFLNKRSFTLGLWQQKYFILRESESCFCEFLIYGTAVKSAWGHLPVRFKNAIPINQISNAEASGSVSEREFVINFLPSRAPPKRFSFSFFRSISKSRTKESPGNESDAAREFDSNSDAGSVASDASYGSRIQQITLQAETAELRLFWVTMINKAIRAAQEAIE